MKRDRHGTPLILAPVVGGRRWVPLFTRPEERVDYVPDPELIRKAERTASRRHPLK